MTPLSSLALSPRAIRKELHMAGTIRVDIDALTALVQYLSFLKSTLDYEKNLIPSLTAQLDAAITGTAPAIASYDSKFSGWSTLLNTLTTDIDSAYATLSAILADALNAINAL